LVTEKGIKIADAVTDNTMTNRKAWIELKQRYPKMYFHGCASHGLHMLVKDLLPQPKQKEVKLFQTIQKVIHLNIC